MDKGACLHHEKWLTCKSCLSEFDQEGKEAVTRMKLISSEQNK